MLSRAISRRVLLKRLLEWCGLAAISAGLPACAVRNVSNSPDRDHQIVSEADALALKEIARRKLHHGGDGFLNLFGGPLRGNPWFPSFSRTIQDAGGPLYNYSYAGFYKDEQVLPVSIDWRPVRNSSGLSITFIKHACIMIKDRNQYILIDPVLFGLRFLKDFTPLAFDIKEMPPPSHVLITHGHYDHLDLPSLSILNPNTHVITPLGYNDLFDDLKMNNRTQLDWFDSFQREGLEVTLLPCKHWTLRNPFWGANRSLWGSFLIRTASGPTIFISGDTSYFRGFREIGDQYSIDLAIFNLGAYGHGSPWYLAHLNPRQAVRAFQDLRAKHLLIVHWGSYRLASEPVHFPPIQLKAELEKKALNQRLLNLNHGETLAYP